MAALTADAFWDWKTRTDPLGDLIELPLAAAVVIYQGAHIGTNPAGYAKAFEPGDLYVGIADKAVSNASGAAAAKNVIVRTTGEVELTLSGAALTHIGKPVFATDSGAIALTGHPDAFVGTVAKYITTSTVLVRLREPGEKAPNGVGSVEFILTGDEAFTVTGATAGTAIVGAYDLKSILGLGFTMNDAEDGGIVGSFDAVQEVALASIRTRNDILPVDKGVTFECDLVMDVLDTDTVMDFDWGLGTALTTNSEASVDHADMVQLACFHMDGNNENILAQSDDNTTDVAAVDTTIDNDSTTDVSKKFKIIVRPAGTVEFWIANARVLATTVFAVLSTANLAPFVNLEKTSSATSAACSFVLRHLRVCGGCSA